MAAGVLDVRLIDPTDADLAETLRKAHATANRSSAVTRLRRDRDFWLRFARDCRREPAGRRRSCKAGYSTPEVIAGWWTDPAGRKHFRVIGRSRARDRRHFFIRGEAELRDLPPWWQVYPESVVAVRRPDGGEGYLACCRCGNVGTPESLGWMGDTCGPCFDRRAEGGTPAGGFGQFNGWAGHYSRVAFSADGARLVGPALSNKLRLVNRADGGETRLKVPAGAAFSVAAAADGFFFATPDGTVYRWSDGKPTGRRVVERPPFYGRHVLDPAGRWSVLASMNLAATADLAAESPRYTQVELARHYVALRFDATGSCLYGITQDGSLFALDPATLAETVVRPDIFSGLPRYAYPHDVAVAADGSALAVVRQVWQPPSFAVRLIPLREGQPVFDLPLPGWYRPSAVAFAPDGKHLVTVDPKEGWVGFWRLPSGRAVGFVRARTEDPGSQGGQVQFSPDGSAVAVTYGGYHRDRGSTVAVWPWPDVMAAAGSA
ncbi:MAG TPA: hypothetical protein VM529_16715 [Gemmata sp.]|nr:hypothetical protein [Gemmata sp.]